MEKLEQQLEAIDPNDHESIMGFLNGIVSAELENPLARFSRTALSEKIPSYKYESASPDEGERQAREIIDRCSDYLAYRREIPTREDIDSGTAFSQSLGQDIIEWKKNYGKSKQEEVRAIDRARKAIEELKNK